MSPLTFSDDGEFGVPLSGEIVPCRSLDDAIAVKAADDILSGNDLTSYPADYLERLVRVLLRYGRIRAACLVSGSVVGLLAHCLGQAMVENREDQMAGGGDGVKLVASSPR